jgi:damage-control phosphatase, subfamily I
MTNFAIIGNIIDFNPIRNSCMEDIMQWFEDSDKVILTINEIDKLEADIKKSRKLLYRCDNCGEICFDKLPIKKIKDCNPNIDIYFGVRGKPVVMILLKNMPILLE